MALRRLFVRIATSILILCAAQNARAASVFYVTEDGQNVDGDESSTLR